MERIELSEIKTLLSKLINKEISREEASILAFKLRNAADNNELEYVPNECKEILWESILFIEGIDLKDSPDTYLHNEKDMYRFLNKL